MPLPPAGGLTVTAYEALDAYIAAKRDLRELKDREKTFREAWDQAVADRHAAERRVSAAFRAMADCAEAEAAA